LNWFKGCAINRRAKLIFVNKRIFTRIEKLLLPTSHDLGGMVYEEKVYNIDPESSSYSLFY
jgi:hypothetical protein